MNNHVADNNYLNSVISRSFNFTRDAKMVYAKYYYT